VTRSVLHYMSCWLWLGALGWTDNRSHSSRVTWHSVACCTRCQRHLRRVACTHDHWGYCTY